jgi:flavin-dependent dehydrogenase
LSQFAGANWLAVGDAALSFDPLSSQGICNALYTGIRAGMCISSALKGDQHAIMSYADHLAAIYQAYLKNRWIFYSYETRWVNHLFWERRISWAKSAAILPQNA